MNVYRENGDDVNSCIYFKVQNSWKQSDLLLLTEVDKTYYVWIKSVSRLAFGRTKSRAKLFVCSHCIHSSTVWKSFEDHLPDCSRQMPSSKFLWRQQKVVLEVKELIQISSLRGFWVVLATSFWRKRSTQWWISTFHLVFFHILILKIQNTELNWNYFLDPNAWIFLRSLIRWTEKHCILWARISKCYL